MRQRWKAARRPQGPGSPKGKVRLTVDRLKLSGADDSGGPVTRAHRSRDDQLPPHPFPATIRPAPHRTVGRRPTARCSNVLGVDSLEDLLDETLPAAIRTDRPLALPAGTVEPDVLAALRAFAAPTGRARA